jgi:hypothetical protein
MAEQDTGDTGNVATKVISSAIKKNAQNKKKSRKRKRVCKTCTEPTKCEICNIKCKRYCKKHMKICVQCDKKKCVCGMILCDSCKPTPILREISEEDENSRDPLSPKSIEHEFKYYCPHCDEMLIVTKINPVCNDCRGKYRCWCNDDHCEHRF